MSSNKKITIIGAGFSSLSAAAFLAKDGYDVTIVEQHEMVGGRARKFHAEGFTFDMGPSWYWMPDVFEQFFEKFGQSVSQHYNLKRLDPGYQVIFEDDVVQIPASMNELEELFESIESGSSKKLRSFLKDAAYNYAVGLNDLVQKPSLSILDFAQWKVIKGVFTLDLFSSISKKVSGLFKNDKLRQILEFPVLFLGATPQNTPALYSLMNYADLSLGTWYPMGGMHEIAKAMEKVALEQGVKFRYNTKITSIEVENRQVKAVKSEEETIETDILIGGADYHHVEQHLLPNEYRTYDEKYWEERTMAPSSLLFYLGIDKKIPNLNHHNLFFDEDFGVHAEEIYEDPKWPSKPLFYACCPSKTDDSVAPEGKENLFLLIPIAPDLEDTEALREQYFDIIMNRLEKHTKTTVRDSIIYKRSYCVSDFKEDYNAYKGNAYGLANTLAQTAIFKPRCRSNKLSNLFYTGQLTVPGPGVPPSIISGEVVAKTIIKHFPKYKKLS